MVFFAGAVLFKEAISRARLVWLIVAVADVVLIPNPATQNVALNSAYLHGCGLALVAAALYALATTSPALSSGLV